MKPIFASFTYALVSVVSAALVAFTMGGFITLSRGGYIPIGLATLVAIFWVHVGVHLLFERLDGLGLTLRAALIRTSTLLVGIALLISVAAGGNALYQDDPIVWPLLFIFVIIPLIFSMLSAVSAAFVRLAYHLVIPNNRHLVAITLILSMIAVVALVRAPLSAEFAEQRAEAAEEAADLQRAYEAGSPLPEATRRYPESIDGILHDADAARFRTGYVVTLDESVYLVAENGTPLLNRTFEHDVRPVEATRGSRAMVTGYDGDTRASYEVGSAEYLYQQSSTDRGARYLNGDEFMANEEYLGRDGIRGFTIIGVRSDWHTEGYYITSAGPFEVFVKGIGTRRGTYGTIDRTGDITIIENLTVRDGIRVEENETHVRLFGRNETVDVERLNGTLRDVAWGDDLIALVYGTEENGEPISLVIASTEGEVLGTYENESYLAASQFRWFEERDAYVTGRTVTVRHRLEGIGYSFLSVFDENARLIDRYVLERREVLERTNEGVIVQYERRSAREPIDEEGVYFHPISIQEN